MDLRFTKYQIPRAARADAETFNKIYLVKNVSFLRATYQIRLLTFKAVESGKKLILKVPQSCRLHATLKSLIKATGQAISRENL